MSSTTTNISDLPEECISHILSFTSPIDVFRSSAISKQFLSASESDVIWNKFLPSNLNEIVSQSSSSPPQFLQQFESKKKLFLHLCYSHILFDNDTKGFSLDKRDAKKYYMLGARALSIVWGTTPYYWTWESLPESRFPEVAKLLSVCWLLIEAKIDPSILSQNTTYGAYFVYKLDDDYNHGFGTMPVETDVYEVVLEEDGSENPLNDAVSNKSSFFLKNPGTRRRPPGKLPCTRDDGWMEIEMGKYYVDDCVNDNVMLKMTLKEIEQLHWKSGLIVQGIQLCPLD